MHQAANESCRRIQYRIYFPSSVRPLTLFFSFLSVSQVLLLAHPLLPEDDIFNIPSHSYVARHFSSYSARLQQTEIH